MDTARRKKQLIYSVMKTGIIISIVLVLVLTFNSCEKNEANIAPLATDCNITNVTYSNTIQPIINLNCAYSLSCHSGGSIHVDLSTYENLKEYANNGRLYEQLFVEYKMPPSPQPLLDMCEATQIKVWINNGSPQ